MARDRTGVEQGPPRTIHPDYDTLLATRLVALIRIAATGPADGVTDDRVHQLARDLIRDVTDAHRYERAAERMVEAYERLEPHEEFEIGAPEPARGAVLGRALQLAAGGFLLLVSLGIGALLVSDGRPVWAVPLAAVAGAAVWIARRAWRAR